MNRQEFMRRWLRAQIEPSLFYVPEKKKVIDLYHIVGLKIYTRYYKADAQEMRTFWFAGGVNPTVYPFPTKPGIREEARYPFSVTNPTTMGRWVIYDENQKIVWSSWKYIYNQRYQTYSQIYFTFEDIYLPKGKYTLVEVVPPRGTMEFSELVPFTVGGNYEECDVEVDLFLQADLLLQAIFPQKPELIVNRLPLVDGGYMEFPYRLEEKAGFEGYDNIINHCAYYEYTITVMDAGNGKLFQKYKIIPDCNGIMSQADKDKNLYLCSNGGGSGEVCDKYYDNDYMDGWCKFMIHVPAKYDNYYFIDGFWYFSSIPFIRNGDGTLCNRGYEELYDCAEGYIEGRYDEQYVLDIFGKEVIHPYPKQWEEQYYDASYFGNYFKDPKPYLVTNYRSSDYGYSGYGHYYRLSELTEHLYADDSFRDWTDNDNVVSLADGRTTLCVPIPATKQYNESNHYTYRAGWSQYMARQIDEKTYDKFIEIDAYLHDNPEVR